ncbi:very short patch repair endonuclease [Peribacillus simplex]|uniref:very short patch repair endonuclease n=1 Tax=Peribacillus simplex TaxID=1478 RepID=UPI0025A20B4C|nr:very short patch repair endonuclease [Peribacillus simplex]MDM5291706.1 very short patch repair endonuclease [Peribacillus simplex]
MVDNLDKAARSEIMKKVKSTSRMEEEVRKALWESGIRFRKNVKNLMGKPDIAINKYKVVIFIDSCFWHACPLHGRIPKSNIDFWKAKLERNKTRDEEVNHYYRSKGWNLNRVWEHELKKDFTNTVEDLVNFIKSNI